MPSHIKSGTIGVIVGALVTFATIMITTGRYKQKIDAGENTLIQHEVRLNEHDKQISRIGSNVDSNGEMLREMRADIKELLKRPE